MRFYPSLLLLYAGGIASVSGGKYETLASLFNETRVQIYGVGSNSVAFSLVPARLLREDEQKSLTEIISPKIKLNTHLLSVLESVFEDLIPSTADLREAFMRFEYIFALVVYQKEGVAIQSLFNTESEFVRGHQQYGEATVPVIKQTDEELARLGAEWPPLKHGIFAGPLDTFKEFKAKADNDLLKRGASNILGY